jgi:hypothetical protein
VNIQNLLINVALNSYSEKILSIMDDIEYRRVTSTEDLEQVAKIRRAAYIKAGSFTDPMRPVTDQLDLDPRNFVFGVWWSGRLVSSIRIHILQTGNLTSNAYRYFPEVMAPMLDQGMTFMDPTKFVIDPELEDDVPGLSPITLRLGFLAAKHFDCDYCLSMIRPRHSAFYRRVFQSTQITPATQFPDFPAPYALHSSPKSNEEPICKSYPIFRSLAQERRQLFDLPARGEPPVLGVRPTARFAIRQNAASPALLKVARASITGV